MKELGSFREAAAIYYRMKYAPLFQTHVKVPHIVRPGPVCEASAAMRGRLLQERISRLSHFSSFAKQGPTTTSPVVACRTGKHSLMRTAPSVVPDPMKRSPSISFTAKCENGEG
jgi:hypothetical protein